MAMPAERFDPLPPDPRQHIQVPFDRIIVDPQIQREQHSEAVQRMAHEWDWDKAEGFTVVAIGDGNYRAVECGHRVLALRLRHFRGLLHVIVLPGPSDPARETNVALGIAKGRRPHDAYEQWQLRLRRGDPHEAAAEKVLIDHGLRLGRSPSATTIAAVSKVKGIIHGRNQPPDLGAELLDQVLTIVQFAFPDHDAESLSTRFNGHLVGAIYELIVRNDGILKDDRLVESLRSQEAGVWLSRAKVTSEPVNIVLRQKIVERYNRNLRAEHRIRP